MQGTVGTEDRWRTCVLATNAAMGFAIAPVFVNKAFSPQSRDIALGMFGEIKRAFSGMNVPSASGALTFTTPRANK